MMSCSFEGQFQIEEKSLNETMILIITKWASKEKKKAKFAYERRPYIEYKGDIYHRV